MATFNLAPRANALQLSLSTIHLTLRIVSPNAESPVSTPSRPALSFEYGHSVVHTCVCRQLFSSSYTLFSCSASALLTPCQGLSTIAVDTQVSGKYLNEGTPANEKLCSGSGRPAVGNMIRGFAVSPNFFCRRLVSTSIPAGAPFARERFALMEQLHSCPKTSAPEVTAAYFHDSHKRERLGDKSQP